MGLGAVWDQAESHCGRFARFDDVMERKQCLRGRLLDTLGVQSQSAPPSLPDRVCPYMGQATPGHGSANVCPSGRVPRSIRQHLAPNDKIRGPVVTIKARHLARNTVPRGRAPCIAPFGPIADASLTVTRPVAWGQRRGQGYLLPRERGPTVDVPALYARLPSGRGVSSLSLLASEIW